MLNQQHWHNEVWSLSCLKFCFVAEKHGVFRNSYWNLLWGCENHIDCFCLISSFFLQNFKVWNQRRSKRQSKESKTVELNVCCKTHSFIKGCIATHPFEEYCIWVIKNGKTLSVWFSSSFRCCGAKVSYWAVIEPLFTELIRVIWI